MSTTIVKLVKSAHSRQKIREDAAACLGYLAIGDGQFFVSVNLTAFLSMLRLSKDTTLNIAIAQGIVYTVLGHEDVHDDNAVAAATNMKTDIAAEEHLQMNAHCDEAVLTAFLNAIINAVADPHPCSRNASSIWLLALVKNLARHPCIYKRKQLLQFAFTELLSDDSGMCV